MAAVTWKITRVATGETKTLEEWGIKGARRSLSNLGADTLTLLFGVADLRGNSPFEFREILRLDRIVAATSEVTTVFRGRAMSPRRAAFGSSEGFSITVVGPWWYFDNLIYTQTTSFVERADANPTPANPRGLQISDFVTKTFQSARILLNTDQAGTRVDTRSMILDALNFAIRKGVPIAIGTIDPGLSVPREELTDATIAEILLKSLRWTPDHSTFFDYSVDPPAFHIRRKADRALLEINIADEEVEEVELNPRDDVSLSGVTMNYLRRHQRNGFEFVTQDTDKAGPNPSGIGALIMTIELYGSYLVQTAAGPPPTYALVAAEAIPIGIATTLYLAYASAAFEGRIKLVEQEVDAIAWTSRTLRVLNGVPSWSDAVMMIQGSDEDLFSGRTELTIGPPRSLGPTDLVGLVRKGRTPAPPLQNILDRDGGSPNSPPFPGGNPDPRLQDPPDKPPDPPHTTHDPANYATLRNGRQGSYSGRIVRQFQCDYNEATSFATCDAANTPAVPIGALPDLSTNIVNQSAFGASKQQQGQRNFTPPLAPPDGPGAGHGFTQTDVQHASASESVWEFDLTVLPSNVIGAELVGTQTVSNADGTSTTTEARLPLAIGQRTTVAAVAPSGATWFNSNLNLWTASGSVSYGTLRLYRAT